MNLTVPPVERRTVDAWTIQGSGLPIRVVHVLTRAGVLTCGELRTLPLSALANLPGMGDCSLRAITQFLKLCADIEGGSLSFPSLLDLLRQFLSPLQLDVLVRRYGLSPDAEGGATLQRIGVEYRRTRERIRQAEAEATAKLRSCAAQACLAGLTAAASRLVLDGHGVLREEELAGLAAPDCLDGYRASGVFRLLADCGPALVRYRDLFTAIRAAEMERAENVLLAAARRWPEPATAERILASVPDFLPNSPPATRTKAADAFLRGTADTIATMDLRFCGSDAALAALLAELLRRLPDPAPIRAIVREFNATVVPGHRKTAPFLARHLSTSPLFTRPSIGRYRLARP